MPVFYAKRFENSTEDCCIRIGSTPPICVTVSSREDFDRYMQCLKTAILSSIFSYECVYLTSRLDERAESALAKSIRSHYSPTNIPTLSLWFTYGLDPYPFTPTIQISPTRSRSMKLSIELDVLCPFPISRSKVGTLHSVLCDSAVEYLDHFSRAVHQYWDSNGHPPKSVRAHHYMLHSNLVTIFYARKISEELEFVFRQAVHKELGLPLDVPLLRRGQAILPVPYLAQWLGPNDELLVCPHEHLKPLAPGRGTAYVVKGRYTYKHYLQDDTNDKNWGCAYRSLQTLISWLMWQGEIMPGPIPSLTDIQSALVRVGDKPKQFVGSRQWIGSMEVSFCLEELYGVTSRILPVSRGCDMGSTAASVLAQHFSTGGGPVMIGGGQLAHTIIGVQIPDVSTPVGGEFLDKPSSAARYLIIDPHFTGPSGQLKAVLDKGWCGWKEASFWKADVFYNLCFLPAVRSGRV
ncbi:Ufm1-specific protease 2 [Clonorchis sinensis]|uniref:Ufm1-specific protease 2 n=3 Tax=Clonorchis sinensis TaxID=79923 RepID=A0A8T1M6A7_CLOSI|nr:Ufm1-specific protease 2 [Clonorchis sinensis]GAA51752.1 Ufm1-specific protease 2 [Clonorchis sinensis]